jgi:hypothetical protein
MIRATMARHIPKDWEAVFAELDGVNDRAVILVVGSLIDCALAEAIKSRLREPDTDRGWNDLFKESGLLQRWSQKTTVAYFLKVIGPIARADIDLLRSIRNEAAAMACRRGCLPENRDRPPGARGGVREAIRR